LVGGTVAHFIPLKLIHHREHKCTTMHVTSACRES